MGLILLWQWHDLEYDLFRNDLHFKLSVGFVSLSLYIYVLLLYSLTSYRKIPLNYVPPPPPPEPLFQ